MNSPQAAARVAAAAVTVTAFFAVLQTGPAAAARDIRPQSPAPATGSLAASAGRVKFYIVPRPGNGRTESLYAIAARTLGSGARFMEIFNLNKGRLQPNGGRLENPHAIEPGWILRLPADAAGPGVHFGRLPVVTTSTTARTSHRPSRPGASPAATPSPAPGGTGSGSEGIVGGALIVFAIAGLGLVLLRRRKGSSSAKRRSAHARAPGPRAGNKADAAMTGLNAGPGGAGPGGAGPGGSGWPYPGTDHPSWPAGATGADWPQPGTDYGNWPAGSDHPSWPAGADHPSWPAAAVDPSWPYPGADHPSWPAGAAGADWPQPGTDYGSWPAGGSGPGRAPGHGGGASPRRESPAAVHHDQHWQTSAPVPVPTTPTGYPARRAGAHAKTQQWTAQLAKRPDTASQTYYDLAFGDGRLQMVLTEPPATDRQWATGLHARPEAPLQLGGEQAGPVAWNVRDFRNPDSVRLAERILSDADRQAAEIRQQATAQATAIREAADLEAAEIRQQASAQATPVREAAEREAAEIRQQASAQATAIREAAEREAAELRAHVLAMSAELGRVAAYVTDNLTSPVRPETPTRPHDTDDLTSPAKPVASPAARPATKPTARPATKPTAQPATKPATKSKSRQLPVMRKMVAALVIFLFVGVVSGAAEIALHGFSFFLFRNTGAGAGNSQNLNEDQGPGQPDAPGAHGKASPGKPGHKSSSRSDKKPGHKPHSKPSRSN